MKNFKYKKKFPQFSKTTDFEKKNASKQKSESLFGRPLTNLFSLRREQLDRAGVGFRPQPAPRQSRQFESKWRQMLGRCCAKVNVKKG